MLSFLIPTYNQVCITLAQELSQQIEAEEIEAEVIVMDDGSTDKASIERNTLINEIAHCRYIYNERNEGRSKIRNKLASTAKYDTMVFLDSDVFPTDNKFVNRYIMSIDMAEVVCGGMIYRIDGPCEICRLRYIIGNKAESFSAEERSKIPYGKFISSNFLVKKSVFEKVTFDESLFKYGYEDVLFGKSLEDAGISIGHIDNIVFHGNEDTGEEYLSKTRSAIENLLLIEDKINEHSRVINLYKKLKKLCLVGPLSLWYSVMRRPMEINLLSEYPSYRLFNVYKISYYCHLKQKS